MSRAIRRHHRRRMIARWARIIPTLPGNAGMNADRVHALAARRATHPGCACAMCKAPRYERPARFDWRSAVAVEG